MLITLSRSWNNFFQEGSKFGIYNSMDVQNLDIVVKGLRRVFALVCQMQVVVYRSNGIESFIVRSVSGFAILENLRINFL